MSYRFNGLIFGFSIDSCSVVYLASYSAGVTDEVTERQPPWPLLGNKVQMFISVNSNYPLSPFSSEPLVWVSVF